MELVGENGRGGVSMNGCMFVSVFVDGMGELGILIMLTVNLECLPEMELMGNSQL